MHWRILKNTFVLISVALVISAYFGSAVFASETNGTIDTTNRYAWSEAVGWIDFGTTEGNVLITDTEVTGYAWGENIGWISLNCSNTSSCDTVDYGVSNNNEGTLSGYAWNETTGWIQFDPTNGGVSIDTNGIFSGYAWGENIGWIVFNCSTTNSCGTVDYNVSTDWRPASSRATDEEPQDSPITGGGRGIFIPPPLTVPEDGYTLFIMHDDPTDKTVTLHFNGGSDISTLMITNDPTFSSFIRIIYEDTYTWTVSDNPTNETVYAKYCNRYRRCSEALSADIIERIPETTEPKVAPEETPKKDIPATQEPPQTETEPIEPQPKSPTVNKPLPVETTPSQPTQETEDSFVAEKTSPEPEDGIYTATDTNINTALTPMRTPSVFLNWKTALLAAAILLLFYIFYREFKRKS